MVSEEKMIHMVHLIIDGLYKDDMVDYPDDDAAMREAKKAALLYLTQWNAVEEAARQRIRTQKNAPMENSPQWENLYAKYCDEELKKRGG